MSTHTLIHLNVVKRVVLYCKLVDVFVIAHHGSGFDCFGWLETLNCSEGCDGLAAVQGPAFTLRLKGLALVDPSDTVSTRSRNWKDGCSEGYKVDKSTAVKHVSLGSRRKCSNTFSPPKGETHPGWRDAVVKCDVVRPIYFQVRFQVNPRQDEVTPLSALTQRRWPLRYVILQCSLNENVTKSIGSRTKIHTGRLSPLPSTWPETCFFVKVTLELPGGKIRPRLSEMRCLGYTVPVFKLCEKR